ncbi:hypothetical protein U6Y60_12910, partial [Lacticaseibacillus paracasei]|uniref:hypothetical protein n=1 Tax=Lacticaseibacillus paracasei TaxID=1597 RepID=UPI002ADEBDB9
LTSSEMRRGSYSLHVWNLERIGGKGMTANCDLQSPETNSRKRIALSIVKPFPFSFETIVGLGRWAYYLKRTPGIAKRFQTSLVKYLGGFIHDR